MTKGLAHCGIVVAVVLYVIPGRVLAGEETTAEAATTDSQEESILSPDSFITRDDWKRRIDDARKRSEQARKEWQLNPPSRAVTEESLAKIATERALNDYTLQSGDIVSTEKGLLQFRGWSGADGRTPQFTPVAPR